MLPVAFPVQLSKCNPLNINVEGVSELLIRLVCTRRVYDKKFDPRATTVCLVNVNWNIYLIHIHILDSNVADVPTIRKVCGMLGGDDTKHLTYVPPPPPVGGVPFTSPVHDLK